MAILSDLISTIYDKERDDWTKMEHPKRQNKAFRFSTSIRQGNHKSNCEICIWGPHNYIGVFVRWTNHFNPELDQKWIVLSYHDSCWRDALGTLCSGVLENRKDHYAYLNGIFEPAGMCKLTNEEMEAFLKLERSRRDDQTYYSTQEQCNMIEK